MTASERPARRDAASPPPPAPRGLRPLPFAELLRRHRIAAGMTQEELAERAAVSARAISDLERGLKSRPQRETVRLLATALGLDAPERDRLLAAARPGPLPVTAPTPTALAVANLAGNLPAAPTPLVGRDDAAAAAVARLRRPEVRLLTITGPGGVGKSRLALAVAEALRPDFPDGVFFVPLAALDDPALVAATIARALSVAERGGQPLAELLPVALRERRLLLLLDNFEHLLPAVATVEALLAGCPGVRVLATSRAALGSPWEHEQPLAPLGLPPRGETDPATLARAPAVALFLQRAAAIRPDFAPNEATIPAVAAICRRLDGLPLALELASARLRLLTPPALLERLDAPLRLLTGSGPALPPRQRTMRAAIAWSYDLLPPEQARAFRRLAVFAGGTALDAAEAVCADGAAETDTLLEAIGALVDHSLVQAETEATPGVAGDEPEPRLTILEVVREFGLEQLRAGIDAPGEEAATRRRHLDYFLELAADAARTLAAAAQAPWLARLEREHDNLRAALGWAIETADAEGAQRLAGALTEFWRIRGYFREGRGWLERALALDDSPSPARARAFLGAGILAWRQADLPVAVARLAPALALARDLGETGTAAAALHYLGIVTSHGGDLDRAWALHEESLALRRALDDRPGMAAALNSLGELARRRGDLERAGAYYAEGLDLCRAADYTFGHAIAVHNLGEVALASGDMARAAACFRESLTLHRGLGNTYSIAYQIAGLASVAALLGTAPDAARAARLFGAAEGIFAATGARMDPADRPIHERAVAAARARLGDATFAAGHAAGRALPLDDAIAEALSTGE